MDAKTKKLALETLEKHKKLVWPEIKKYLKDPSYPKEFIIPQKYQKVAQYHWEAVRDYPERKGKYLRPTLLLLTAKAMGVSVKKALKTAAAMQLSEEWMLAHDDFEDDSLKRRGKLALHRVYTPEFAVNAGDMLHGIMWKILRDNLPQMNLKMYMAIIDEFYIMLMRTILGQGVEIKWMQSNLKRFSDDQWFFVADGKTSYYTSTLPIRLGAVIAGASQVQLEKITAFGLNLGRCFQLIDDVLDVTSDFSGLKQKGGDVYEGKKTVILGHLLRRSNKKDRDRINEILKKKREKKSQAEVDWVIGKMHGYGSIDYAKDLAKIHKQRAEKIFEKDLKFLSGQPARDQMKSLITFILERDH